MFLCIKAQEEVPRGWWEGGGGGGVMVIAHCGPCTLQGPQCVITIKDAFTCQSSGLVYAISCRRCSTVYIGETGRTLRERFGEHLRSIEKSLPGFPVAEHCNSNGHALQVRGVMPCDGNKNRKRQEMRLIFKLGQEKMRGQRGTLRALAGICRFH